MVSPWLWHEGARGGSQWGANGFSRRRLRTWTGMTDFGRFDDMTYTLTRFSVLWLWAKFCAMASLNLQVNFKDSRYTNPRGGSKVTNRRTLRLWAGCVRLSYTWVRNIRHDSSGMSTCTRETRWYMSEQLIKDPGFQYWFRKGLTLARNSSDIVRLVLSSFWLITILFLAQNWPIVYWSVSPHHLWRTTVQRFILNLSLSLATRVVLSG